jgi:DNA polymerase delta subunit 3
VASFDTSDFSMLYTACKDIPKLSLEDRIKCGILKNSKVVIRQLTPARLVGNKAVPAPTGKVPFATPSKTAVATTPANKSSPASTATKRKGTLSFGPATTKKQAVATPTKNEPKPKAVPATPSTATKTQVKAKPDSGKILFYGIAIHIH